MDEQKSTEQIEHLRNWAAERDAILAEIAVLKDENGKLIAVKKDLAATNSDLETRIIQATTRINELAKREQELVGLTNTELASLSAEKSSLQSDVVGLKSDVKLLTSQKDLLVEVIGSLTEVHNQVYAKVGMLDKVVDNVVRMTNKHLDEMNAFIKNLIK